MLLFLENAGTDLESYKFDKTCGWRQAVDVLWQVADSLATAEKETEFEVRNLTWYLRRLTLSLQHRDLHEGQVLLSASEMGDLRATIIDFGLSRAKSAEKQELFWSKIPEDVFDGQGEQWDVYRAMQTHIKASGGDWDGFHPVTNLMVSLLKLQLSPQAEFDPIVAALPDQTYPLRYTYPGQTAIQSPQSRHQSQRPLPLSHPSSNNTNERCPGDADADGQYGSRRRAGGMGKAAMFRSGL